jgi:iron complex outermembrane receptor protein
VPIDTAGTELALNANMYARSRKPGNGLASLNSPIEGYALFNARVDLNNIGGSAMSLGAFSRNITNKKYTIARGLNLNTGGYDFRQFGEPRTYGIEVRLKF